MDPTSDLNPFNDEVGEIEDDDALDLPNMEEENATIDDGYIEEAEKSTKTMSTKKHFTVLSESDIKQLQCADINEVSHVLLISRVAACLLLFHYEWSVTKVVEAWFDNEEKVRKAVGLLKQPQVAGFSNSQVMCEICFETFSSDMIKSAWCGHTFCIDCWKQYTDINIEEGPDKCLTLRCPEPTCDAAVDEDMIHQLASESSKKKYDRFMLRSYVENNKNMKWCPAPACENAVSYEAYGFRKNYDVTCLCHRSFCWSCGEEAHSPVDCETVDQWIKKNNSESENIAWIIAYTKPCPQCKKPIEKNEGCKHMKCNCRFHFCWLCLRDWSECGHNGCNSFSNTQVQDFEEINNGEMKRKMWENSLDRYIHYYERWDTNEFSRKNALQNLIDLSTMDLKKLGMSDEKPKTDFNILRDAWKLIVECRRVLKWTYVYGYYLPENEMAKMEFFECIQGIAEFALEDLHYYAENELRNFLNVGSRDEFNDFRGNLINMTKVTKKYFKNLVKALENGLDDVQVKNYTEDEKRVK